MSEPETAPATTRALPVRLLTLGVCLLILLGAGGVVLLIYQTEPEAEREGAVRRSAMRVEVVQAERGNFRPVISALGTVMAAQDIVLRPRVSGEVIEIADSFSPGGQVRKGDLLLEIDPADYVNALTRSQSELLQAQAELRLEMGQQEVAMEELKRFDGDLDIRDPSLILREPQLESIQARVASAEAAVEQAKLDLERTRITAPFDAQVLDRTCYVGSQVGPADALGRLIGLEEYWVIVTVPLNKVYWLDFAAGGGTEGSNVVLRNRAAWPEGVTRSGYAERLIGVLDEATRLARILVTVENPLARGEDPGRTPPLVVGAVLDARITGRELKNVVRIHRDHVRQNNTVWLKKEGKLEIGELSIVFQDAEYAYVDAGLESGDWIVTTNLRTVTPGVELNAIEAGTPPADPEAPLEEGVRAAETSP